MLKMFITFFILIGPYAQAQEFRYLARSPKALLMGDAFTAIADDEYTLFYNPASLGKNRGFHISPVNASIGVTNALDDLDRFKDFPSDAVDIAARIMDYPVYTQLGTAPGVKVGGFGFSLIANNTSTFLLKNQAHPMLDVDYRYDRGFVMGYAVNLTRNGPRLVGMDASQGHRFTLGASVKHIKRDGVKDSYSFFGTTILNAINNSNDFSELRENLGFSKGEAWGADVGVEYAYVQGRSEFLLGLSLMDILDTGFDIKEGNRPLPDQKMNLNFGSAFRQDYGLFDYTLSFDVHPILESYDYRRKLHFGAKVGLPLVDVFGGWSGGYLSYGGSLKLWPFKLTAGLYSTEIGADYNDNRGSRAIIYISLLDTALRF